MARAARQAPTSSDGDTEGFAIGAAAARLGVAPETLRSWGTRYGLVPSATTSGGHRRYTRADLCRLAKMQRLVAEGSTPARAAAAVLAAGAVEGADDEPLPEPPVASGRPGGPGGRVLAVPGGTPEARGIARAASRLDADAVADRVRRLLVERGAIATWDAVLCPVLVAAGERWARTGEGIEIEHLLSEVAGDELRAHRRRQPAPAPSRPALLACFPGDLHTLPLQVLSAALAEARMAHHVLGARVPLPSLAAAARRTGARAVFVWRQLAAPTEAGTPRGIDVTAALPGTRPAIRVVVGGAGWQPDGGLVDVPAGALFAPTLSAAVALLRP